MNITDTVKNLALVDIFKDAKNEALFVGRPFYLDYDKAYLLIADSRKLRVGGIPQGSFLLAFYENEDNVKETLLMRAIKPAKLPTDNDVISSMIEYYKDNLKTTGKDSKLDDFTRYEFSFSGLESRILGTFYHNDDGKTIFGADVENFYSAHNYSVYKPEGKVLELIANLRDGNALPGGSSDVKIGRIRYSSSLRFQSDSDNVPVYVSPKDFLGKRTALFGMTRTGKSNTVKKIIEASVSISKKSKSKLGDKKDIIVNALDPFDINTGSPKYPVGQIIFDINGEYANANLQDEGTAIFEMFKDDVTRYSVIEKPGFKVMKINFYQDVGAGFDLIRSLLEATDTSDYVRSFCAIDLTPPDAETDESTKTRQLRKIAAYKCCLYRAGFETDEKSISFPGNKEINDKALSSKSDPKKGISIENAAAWFTWVWDNYDDDDYFSNYRKKNNKEWADEDLKSILIFLTRKRSPGPDKAANISGYRKLRGLIDLHTKTVDKPFADEIAELLRNGKIIIVDLSQGDPEIQKLYSERICRKIFQDSMNRFISAIPNNFMQFYFEEAHNLFPKKEDKDLSQIYNRLAKEGAKLNIGLIYATQEVSSISSNILKNTQNWFIAHLNNEDEIKELRKYYDFEDFADSLIRFSASSDKGFVRMKTYTNPFVVPVQIDRFLAK